jgi:hypothetical protein
MLANLQFEPTKRKQIRGRREAEVDVNASSNICVQHAIDPPTSTSCGSDPDVNRFPSEIANHSSALRSKCGVGNEFILKVTGTRGFQEHCRSRKSPPCRELDQATAVVAGVVQLPPKECSTGLRHVTSGTPSMTAGPLLKSTVSGDMFVRCPDRSPTAPRTPLFSASSFLCSWSSTVVVRDVDHLQRDSRHALRQAQS